MTTPYNQATLATGKTFSNGEYYHAVLSISGTTHTLYLDGSMVAQNTNAGNIFSAYSSFNQLNIGCDGSMQYGFSGKVDDFRIYTRPLLQTDVSLLYNSVTLPVPNPIVKIRFTNSGTNVNTGTLSTATVTLSNNTTNKIGPDGLTTVYQLAGKGVLSGGTNELKNFGTLYNFSVSWWQSVPTSANHTLFALGNETARTRLFVTNDVFGTTNYSYNNFNNVGTWGGSEIAAGSITYPTDGTWFHRVMTFSNNTTTGAGVGKVYHNGVLRITYNYTNYINGFTKFLFFPDFANYYYIYNLNVHNNTLTDSQVLQLYTNYS